MNILMIGATGFIGRSTFSSLKESGHSISVWTRSPTLAHTRLGTDVELVDIHSTGLRNALEEVDVVINLAGSPIAGVRWTKGNKQAIENSRVQFTNLLAHEILRCKLPPSIFISASAVGYYGDRGNVRLGENAAVGDGYLAELCAAWEESALQAQIVGTRVCTLRFGIVINHDGGLLKALAPALITGIFGYPGRGTQFTPWIHMEDTVRIINHCIIDSRISGAINCTAPCPTTSKYFFKEIQRASGGKLTAPIPITLLRLLFGKAATALISSQNAVPEKLETLGFKFKYPTLKSAMEKEFPHSGSK